METRFLNMNQAAEYCGYKPNSKQFRRLVKEYAVPKCGPEGNRVDRFDLDEWMRNPRAFLNSQFSTHRRRPGGFTPVKARHQSTS